jgi:Family of unknown function (DUF5683)
MLTKQPKWLIFLLLVIGSLAYPQMTVQNPRADSLGVKDSVSQTEAKKEKPKTPNKFYKSSGRAMLFSAILPGAGQYYSENYLKGALMTAAWGTLGFLAIREHEQARSALNLSDTVSYLSHRDQRNLWLWWTAAVWVFSIADAYVSSNMYKFKQQETLSASGSKLYWDFELGPELSVSFNLKRFF